MKTFFILSLAICAGLSSVQADIPAPKPLTIIVTNLAAFPAYKFSYHEERRNETRPIHDGRAFSVLNDAQLLVQTGTEAAQVWEKINYDWKGGKATFAVDNVKQNGKAITVTFKKSTGSNTAPGTKSATAALPQALSLFALMGVGACGLVVLNRKRKAH